MNDQQAEIRRIDGRARVLDTVFEMIQGSKKEVIMGMRYWGSRWGDRRLFDEVIFPRLEDAIRQALKTGASVRILGDLKSDDFGSSKKLHALGAEVKNLEGNHLRFIVVDMKECLFAISEPYTETTDFYHAVWSKNAILVEFFKDSFESLWPVCQRLSI